VNSGYWQDLGSGDFPPPDVEATVALLPVAAVEQHGPHLPLSTDAAINDGLVHALLACGTAPATLLVLPSMRVGHSPEHADFPGTLSVDSGALLDAWVGVGRSVARAGVRKLVILNSHGGQIPLVDLAAVRLRAEAAMLVARVTTFRLGCPPGLFDADELAHGIHGGEVETSLMLHLCPQAVRRDALTAFDGLPARWAADGRALGVEKPLGVGWMAQDLHPQGVCGRADRADAKRGAALLEHWVGMLGRVVAELAATPLSVLAQGPRSRGGG
jgi:creatinine amidohydrolase